MAQFLGFGSGKDGLIPTSGVLNAYASVTATSGQQTVTTTLPVSLYDLVVLYQTQGAGAGNWEIVTVVNVNTGSFNCAQELANTYTTGAQAVKMPQYTGGEITGAVSPINWNGTTGGVVALCTSGKLIISDTLSATGSGYRNGSGDKDQGEGTLGVGTSSNSANGNGAGGGGGNIDAGHVEAGHGAGGGNGTVGISPATRNTSPGGTRGSTAGSADLTTAVFGGAGGAGGNGWDSGLGRDGGDGGGLIFIFSRELIVTGSVSSNGTNGVSSNDRGGAGGAGAGGSIFIKSQTAIIGSNLITATGGIGGACSAAFNGSGGNGGSGRIRIEACSLNNGGTTPVASTVIGGLPFCFTQSAGMI